MLINELEQIRQLCDENERQQLQRNLEIPQEMVKLIEENGKMQSDLLDYERNRQETDSTNSILQSELDNLTNRNHELFSQLSQKGGEVERYKKQIISLNHQLESTLIFKN